MPIIIIKSKVNYNTEFLYKCLTQEEREELDWNNWHRLHCRSCGNKLTMGFTHIIRNLAKAGILAKEFIENDILCCLCRTETEKMRKEYNFL